MIAQLLQKSRAELLELGLRNTLLNHRATKSRGVSIVEMRSAYVFQRLVADEALLTFAPVGAELGDATLKSPYEDPVLQSRLLATYYAARTHIEERGVNILFLALGMLHWFEDDSSDKELRAPLLLVPVELSRTSAKEKFSLGYNEEEIEGNLSLAARLAEMGIRHPELPEIESLSLEAYFRSVARAVAGQARWKVEPDEIYLGFFSFSKFLMYKDLDPGAWCSAENPDGTPILAALLRDGFRREGPVVGEDQYLDKQIAPNVLRQVVDADSSQALAMLDIKSGANLVIQGPPGTGKSQTITNVIADAIGDGKHVLFVAEKSAALDVVKRRLDKVGLGDACLELHSHSANKKAVLAELERTLRLGRPHAQTGWSLEHYKRVRDQLNAYCLALNTPVEGTDWTPQQIMGELAAIRERQDNRSFPVVGLDANSVLWSKSTFRQKLDLVARLADLLGRLGVPNAHPLIVSGLTAVLPSDREAVEEALAKSIRATSTAIAALSELGALMGISYRCDRADADVLIRAAQRALTAPHLKGVEVRASEWAERRDDLQAILDAGSSHTAIRRQHESVLIEEAWTQDLLATREVLNTTGRKWWRWLSSDYRAARRRVSGLCLGEHAKDADSQLELVDAIMYASRQRRRVEELQPLASKLFGVQWQGLKSDWDVLRRIFEWIVDLYRDVGAGQCPDGLVDFLDGDPALETITPRLNELSKAVGAYDEAFRVLCERLVIDPTQVTALQREDLAAQGARLEAMAARLGDLSLITSYNNLAIAFADEQMLWVLDACRDWPTAPALVVDFARRTCLEALLRRAYEGRPALRTADGTALTSARLTFQQLDEASLQATRLELASKHYEGLPRVTGIGQVGVLMREFEKKSRHLPIRRLVTQAGSAIQAIKPVLMMSPMSIAAFLPPGRCGSTSSSSTRRARSSRSMPWRGPAGRPTRRRR